MVNHRLRSMILEVVDNQMKMNEPKCTKREFKRLVKSGISEQESRELIAAVLAEEMFYLMKNGEPFNERLC